ncbi:Npun_F0296 family exosortase-dependent surface protein [Sandarakinorhabdus sp.]|uniref:Npun_F0296 family exosortase-dependent surface protein n=1 Tax=Sandarakinorhabdus sp. TaxID=1916663 RepID=UPI003F704CC1
MLPAFTARAIALAALAVATLAAVPAAAATLVSLPGAPDPGPFAGETLVVSFDTANAAGFVWQQAPATRASSLAGTAAMPAGGDGTFAFLSTASLRPSTATLLTPALRSISLYWGSIDGHNKVTLFGRDGQALGEFTGNQLPMPNGSWMQSQANRRVGFVAEPGRWIHGMRLDAGGVAFEFDSIAANAVPEPGSWTMLIAGFGLVGAMQRRRGLRVVAG